MNIFGDLKNKHFFGQKKKIDRYGNAAKCEVATSFSFHTSNHEDVVLHLNT